MNKKYFLRRKLFILGKDQDKQYNLYSFSKTMATCLNLEKKQVGAATKPDKRDMAPLGDAYQTFALSFAGQE